MQHFPQTGYIKLADLSLTFAPLIAIVTTWLQLFYIGIENLHTIIAMSLLILSLPVHAYYLLGKQAEAKLPSGMKRWYKELEDKLKQQLQAKTHTSQDIVIKKSSCDVLTYMDLAKLLKVNFEQR